MSELYIPIERPERNLVNGRFLKGHTPHNKGKKWADYMDMRKAKRIKNGRSYFVLLQKCTAGI